jgi:hypothetical protein
LCLSGCGDPTIDASSDESMMVSIEKVRNALPDNQKEKFDKSLQVLAFSNFNFEAIIEGGAIAPRNIRAKVKGSINGKTGEEVIAAADEIIRLRKNKQKQQAMKDMTELEDRAKRVVCLTDIIIAIFLVGLTAETIK